MVLYYVSVGLQLQLQLQIRCVDGDVSQCSGGADHVDDLKSLSRSFAHPPRLHLA